MDLVVGELPLKDCFSFWRSSAKRVSLQEKLDLLSITGGVPKYLEELNPALSTDENIRALCFSPEGLLFRDFNQIFHEVFGNRSTIRKDILKALSNGPLTVTALAEALGKETSGHLSDYLEELELSGFIAKDMWINPRTKKPALMARYRLKDNYARFYLHYIEPRNHEVENGLYQFTSLENLPGWQTILGLQFENMMVGNFQLLLPKIGLNGVSLLSASPRTSYRRSSFTIAKILANLGADFHNPIIDIVSNPPQEKAWLNSYYIQEPKADDDPYRYYRW